MPENALHFPDGFRWGAATAAHQAEGGNTNNDWYAWEQQPGRIKQGQKSGRATDWWNNAEADLDRMAEMGLNALRLSVEWSRIEPRPGSFDSTALDRYVQMLRAMRERDIEPMITLHHFTNPLWLVELGGWESADVADRFARFTRMVVETLGPYCNLWCTINEPNVYAYEGYMDGIFPPGRKSARKAMQIIKVMLEAHAKTNWVIHEVQLSARVGFAPNLRILDPANPANPLDRMMANLADGNFNRAMLSPDLKGSLDWTGVNYYTRDLVAFNLRRPGSFFVHQFHGAGAELLDGGYGEYYPEGMYRTIKWVAPYQIPIYITENGIPDSDDDQRPRYLLEHLYQLWRAIQDGCPIKGYYHWTLVDNFEWAEGWLLRFGLIGVDPETQVRTPRPSAALYAEMAKANAITEEMVDKYAPGIKGKLFGIRK